MNLKEYIIEEGLKLGFSRIGIAPADYDPQRHNVLMQWLYKGLHGGMSYMEKRTRARFDPKVHLPEALSVIVCAQNYYSEPTDDSLTGYVSIHARGYDYHDVMQDKLKTLRDRILDIIPDMKTVITVDTSTVSEKTLGVRAGIGFIGKNSLLIIPRDQETGTPPLGSFHFLGIIITSLKIEPDNPLNGTCGKCRRCIEACPTRAIVGDCKIDTEKCISYHNTHSKKIIPDSLADKMGNMVYGCDICQLVCPYNGKSSVTTEQRLLALGGLSNIDITGFLDLDINSFNNRYKGTCIGSFGYEAARYNFMAARRNIDNK